jgi:hypothetical protein
MVATHPLNSSHSAIELKFIINGFAGFNNKFANDVFLSSETPVASGFSLT